MAIQAQAISIPPVPHRLPLWETNTGRGQRLTGRFDYLLGDMVKKHMNNLENLLRAPVAGLAGPAGPAAPVAAVDNR